MKKLIVLLVLSSMHYCISAQTTDDLWYNISSGFNCQGCCYNLGQCGWDPYACWEVDTTNHNNIWHNGTDSIYDSHCFTTSDSINPYPINTNSSFEFMVTDWPLVTDCFGGVEINITHTYDTDTLRDGGYIELSFDNKQTWYNIMDTIPYLNYFGNGGPPNSPEFYSHNDTLFNGQYGFSGRKENIYSHFGFELKPQYNCSQDTFYFRFTFISDSINNQKKGWQINSISLIVQKGYPMKINSEYYYTNIKIPTILTRCTENEIFFDAPEKLNVRLTDITGKTVLMQEINGNSIFLDCNITPGIYALNIYNNEFIKTAKVLIK